MEYIAMFDIIRVNVCINLQMFTLIFLNVCVCVDFFLLYRSHVKQIGNICAISSVNLKSFKQQLNFIVMHSKTHIESTNIS